MARESIMLSEMSQTEKRHIPCDFLHTWNLKTKTKQVNKQNNTRNKLIEADNGLVVTRREEGKREGEMRKGRNCTVTGGNQTFAGKHVVVRTNADL